MKKFLNYLLNTQEHTLYRLILHYWISNSSTESRMIRRVGRFQVGKTLSSRSSQRSWRTEGVWGCQAVISRAEQKALVSRQGGVHRRLRPAGREQMRWGSRWRQSICRLIFLRWDVITKKSSLPVFINPHLLLCTHALSFLLCFVLFFYFSIWMSEIYLNFFLIKSSFMWLKSYCFVIVKNIGCKMCVWITKS